MLALTGLTLAVTFIVARTRLGFGLTCIRQNEDAAGIVGVHTSLYKVVAFVLSGSFAAAAGAVYASWTGYIEPGDVYDVLFSVKPIIMVLLGGPSTVFGPIIGAAAFLILDEVVWRNFLEIHGGILGLLIVVLIIFSPGGLSRRSLSERYGRGSGMTTLLELRNVSRSFGGVHAIRDVSFSLEPGQIVGLIGPNGAGKSTLVDVITGVRPATSGEIIHKGDAIQKLKPYQISARGIARTFQIVQPFPDMTVIQNVMAGQCSRGQLVRWLMPEWLQWSN